MRLELFFLSVLLALFSCKNIAQPPVIIDTVVSRKIKLKEYPFEKDIQKFEESDKLMFPPQGAVLFIGSSTIRMWKSLQGDMSGLTVINRGFGGSSTCHVLHYMDRIVFPYRPSKIVYYCGDNDIASGVNPDSTMEHYRKFIVKVHDSLPGTKIYFVSNKPSLKRQKNLPLQKSVNESLKNLCDNYTFVSYIDIFPSMMINDSTIKADIFKNDSLHLNNKGYAIWTGIIKNRLVNE